MRVVTVQVAQEPHLVMVLCEVMVQAESPARIVSGHVAKNVWQKTKISQPVLLTCHLIFPVGESDSTVEGITENILSTAQVGGELVTAGLSHIGTIWGNPAR